MTQNEKSQDSFSWNDAGSSLHFILLQVTLSDITAIPQKPGIVRQ